jgi:hypothetical protein
MAAKSLTARESIEAAFSETGKRKLKAAEIIAHVEANKNSAIGKGTIRTQLQVQSSKGTWIKRVAPATYSLVAQKASAEKEVKPDPKPSERKQQEKAAA